MSTTVDKDIDTDLASVPSKTTIQTTTRARRTSTRSLTRHLDLAVKLSNAQNEVLRVVQAFFGVTRDFYSIERMRDGITNIVLCCTRTSQEESPHPDKVLIRVYGMNTEMIIDREDEIRNHLALHEKGFAALLYGSFRNGLVYGFVNGSVCTPEDLASPDIAALIATKLAKMHNAMTISHQQPTCFSSIVAWIEMLPETFPVEKDDADYQALFNQKRLMDYVAYLEEPSKTFESTVVLCHNDLLAGNVIISPDRDDVTFIDFEYCNPNPVAFDIGNHLNEYAGLGDYDVSRLPSDEKIAEWISNYLTASHECEPAVEAVEELAKQAKHYSKVSHLFWAVWSVVQALNSEVDFDYFTYAKTRIEVLKSMLPSFD